VQLGFQTDIASEAARAIKLIKINLLRGQMVFTSASPTPGYERCLFGEK